MQRRISKAEFLYKLEPVKVAQALEVDDNDVAILLNCGWIEPERGEPGYVYRRKAAESKAD